MDIVVPLKAFINPTAMAINRYVISFIGIGSVLYRRIAKTANIPKAKPISILILAKEKATKKIKALNMK
jgi:hypothetical protein